MNAIKNYYHDFIDKMPEDATDLEIYEQLMMLSGIKESAKRAETEGYKTLEETREIMLKKCSELAEGKK